MKKLTVIFFLFLIANCFGQKQFEVFFDFNIDYPNQQSIEKLNAWIEKNKKAKILKVEGYCDSIDTKDYNKKLSERRIENVLKILKENNIEIISSIEKTAFGKEFKQSKIQEENRKVIIYYEVEESTKEKSLSEKINSTNAGETIKLPNIYFYNNSARIVPKSNETLYELLCALQENTKLKIEIQGHICCQQVFDLNDVSTARARAIYNFLLRNKISKNRMTFKGYGTSRPVYKIPERNSFEEDENRRVEIMILEK
jgi:outer membrane protein OmpA-like peptidoglycan-associated protein